MYFFEVDLFLTKFTLQTFVIWNIFEHVLGFSLRIGNVKKNKSHVSHFVTICSVHFNICSIINLQALSAVWSCKKENYFLRM